MHRLRRATHHSEPRKQVSDDGVKALFVELRDEEKRHQEMIEETKAKIPAGEEFDPDDFVDPPAAQ